MTVKSSHAPLLSQMALFDEASFKSVELAAVPITVDGKEMKGV